MFNFQYVWYHFLDLNYFLLLQLIFVFTSSLKQLISRRAFIPFQVLTMHLKDCLHSAVYQLWREYLKLNKFDKFIFYLLDQDLLNLFLENKVDWNCLFEKVSPECNQRPHNWMDRETLPRRISRNPLWKSLCFGWAIKTQIGDLQVAL